MITANAMEAPIRTRRGPKAAPIQTAMIVTNICAVVCAVVIQAPSSNPACTAPRMSARPNEENRVLRVEMNVPMSTANSPSHGMEVGGETLAGAMMPAGSRRGVLARERSFPLAIHRVNARHDRHARHQSVAQAVRIVDHDLDRYALHDLGEVPGRIVGRQQGELGTRGRRKRLRRVHEAYAPGRYRPGSAPSVRPPCG